MRFFLDEDLSDEVAVIARGMGLDVRSVHEDDREGLDDDEQFEYAIERGMVMVARNRDDYIALSNEFFEAGKQTCGLLIVPWTKDQSAAIASNLLVQNRLLVQTRRAESLGDFWFRNPA